MARTTAYTVMWLITVLIVLIPFYIGIMFIVEAAIDSSLPTHNIENYILFNRVFYSKNSVFFVDDYTGRVYLHIVDSNKFNEDTLKNLFETIDANVGFGLYLETEHAIKEIFYNKHFYENAIIRYKKSEKYDAMNEIILVSVIHEDGHIEKGKLNVTAVFGVK